MKIGRFAASVGFFAWLFIPTFAHAHALSLLHYPIGIYPFAMLSESWHNTFVLLANIFVGTLVLWAFVRSLGFWGNLWREILLYIGIQGAETAILFCVMPALGCENPGWGLSGETIVSLFFSFLAGLALAFLIARLFYKKANISTTAP